MPQSPQDDVAAAISSITTRSEREVAILTLEFVRACWPGGVEDRLERVAVPWVKRWGPARMTLALAACSCADGRCSVCN
jgi:hypothetical protein